MAMYRRAVSHYKATNDHTVLGKIRQGSFEPPTRPAHGRARQFHGCIRNEAESSPKSDWLRIKSVNRVFAVTLTLQRLFSTFAEGWPGAGLLLQRVLTSTILLYCGNSRISLKLLDWSPASLI